MVSVSIGRFVEFVDEDTVQASVTVTCTSGSEVLEASRTSLPAPQQPEGLR